MKHVNILVV